MPPSIQLELTPIDDDPQLNSGALARMVHEAAEYERQTGTFSHQPRSFSPLRLHRETLVLTQTEQPPRNV